MIENMLKDLRYGMRTLLKNPGFTTVAVLSLALGIGVNTTIFSLVNAVLLRPLPVHDPASLVDVYTGDSDYPYVPSSYPDFRDFRDQSTVFDGLVAYQVSFLNLHREEGPSELVFNEVVSGDYFDMLGVEPALGRTFRPEEDSTPGTHPVVVLGHGFWLRAYNGDPGIVGRTIKVNGNTLTVIGVAAEGFAGMWPLLSPDLWTTYAMEVLLNPGGPDPEALERRGSSSVFIKGRLAEGVSVEEAEAQLKTIAARLAEEYPDTNEEETVNILPAGEVSIHPFVDSYVTPVAGLLMGIVGLVLLIACANVANMLLSRASARRHEIAVRLALGAGRWRLVRQLLSESILLGLVGGAAGLLLAYWTTGLLLAFQPPIPLSVALDLGIDVRVLGFTFLAAILTGVIFGLAPAMQATRPELVSALKDGAARGGQSRRKLTLRNFLVVAQVAVSLVLLIAAGLFIRSLRNTQTIDPGFETENIAILGTGMELLGYEEEQSKEYFRQVKQRVENLPGVESVAFSTKVPVGMTVNISTYIIEDYEPPSGDETVGIDTVTVDVEYFRTMGITMARGRAFTDADVEGAPQAVIVNEEFARRYWPGGDPIGKRVWRGDREQPSWEVVGIAADYKVRTVGEDQRPIVHFPYSQRFSNFLYVLVRTSSDPAPMVETVRQEMMALEPDVVFLEAKTMAENMELTTFPIRMGAMLLGVFGLLALGLAAVGLYGVIAYAVSQRTHEIGLRMALGAESATVLRLVIRQGMTLVSIGVFFGLLGATALTWLLSGFLYGIGAVDPLTFGVTSVILLAVALAANLIPARRASSVDPMIALRYE